MVILEKIEVPGKIFLVEKAAVFLLLDGNLPIKQPPNENSSGGLFLIELINILRSYICKGRLSVAASAASLTASA